MVHNCPVCGYRLDSDGEGLYCGNCGWRPTELSADVMPDE